MEARSNGAAYVGETRRRVIEQGMLIEFPGVPAKNGY
jgi:hypothetical protein